MTRTSFLLTVLLAATVAGCPGTEDEPRTDPCVDLPSGAACTWLGIPGDEGHDGDGLRYQILINQVQDMVFVGDGTAWFSDFNNYLLRRVHPDGTVESMVGTPDLAFPGDGPLTGIPPEGAPGDTWRLNHPTNLVLDTDGALLLVGWHNHKILRIDPATAFVTIVAGRGSGFAGDGGLASTALFTQPSDATVDDTGNLYIVDQRNQRIRRIDTADMVSTIAGTGMAGYAGDGGPAAMAQFAWESSSNPNPSGGILEHEGKLYVSDTENHRIRVIDLATMTVSTLAGTGTAGDGGDGGPASAALLHEPRDLEIGPEGDLYFADTNNARIRAINLTDNTIRTVAGTGVLGLSDEEQLPATETLLRRPFGLTFDPDGNLYIMDTLNSRVVKVAR